MTCSGKCEGTLCADSLEVFAKMDALNTRLHREASTIIRGTGQRVGQAYFNALAALEPELADLIRGTEDDPFYDDSNIDRFMRAVMGNAEFDWHTHLAHAHKVAAAK